MCVVLLEKKTAKSDVYQDDVMAIMFIHLFD